MEEVTNQIQRKPTNLQNAFKNFQSQQFDQKAIFLCQFCGGITCSQQDYRANTIQPNAIDGLHSNWISQNILAMQRPSQRLIKQFSLYSAFKDNNINTILNLQQPGQHPYCGDGIIPKVGFSYNPQGFFAHHISFFNESWEDMTATTFEHMMKIMNIFYNSIVVKGGKIAVHCHAGRGRTLLVICSWLIYHHRIDSKQVIGLAIQKRQGVLSRSSQKSFLHEFQAELKQRWCSFNANYQNSFQEYVEWQTISLLKYLQNNLKYTPYLHWSILASLKNRIKTQALIIAYCLINNTSQSIQSLWNQNMDENINKLKIEANNLKLNCQQNSTLLLIQLLFDFYDKMPYTIIDSHTMDQLIQLQEQNKNASKIQILCEPAIVHDIGLHGIAVILDFIIFIKNLETHLIGNQLSNQGLYLRIALMLFSKRKYNSKIFNLQKRQCNLTNQKNKKYINEKIYYLSTFLQELAKQTLSDQSFINSLMMKIRKVDANLYYYTQNHRKQNKLYEVHEAKNIFSQAKIDKHF